MSLLCPVSNGTEHGSPPWVGGDLPVQFSFFVQFFFFLMMTDNDTIWSCPLEADQVNMPTIVCLHVALHRGVHNLYISVGSY